MESFVPSAMPAFADLQDDTPLFGRDVKTLRDATSSVITQVWHDSRATAALLSKRINEGNTALTEQLNESFAAVGKRLDNLPLVAMFQPDAQGSRISPFTGYNEDGAQFSIWLRRFEDIMRMRPTTLTDEQQANFLIGHLEGVAREKVEELDSDARKSYGSVVSHLRSFFESPQQRYVARQKLSGCRQESGESCTAFANRVLNLVRAATSGQDLATQKERVLEEFVARLRGDVRYFVKLENPTTFEQAVTKAQTVEQLLSEAAAERLLHPTMSPAAIQVLSRGGQGSGQVRYRNPLPQGVSPRGSPRSRSTVPAAPVEQYQRPSTGNARPGSGQRCFNCNGLGHFASVCPSPQGALSLRPPTPLTPATRRFSNSHRFPAANLLSLTSRPTAPASDNYLGVTLPTEPLGKVAQLSASLEDTQRQLRNSQARIEALLRRNDELAQSSMDPTTSPQARVSGSPLPDVRLLFFTAVTVCLLVSPGSAMAAWLCPPDHPTTFFVPQQLYNCSAYLPNNSVSAYKLSLHL
uniref:CCHC-type domain-containing protein n=1 Tax=Haemonchus contortus TaxID=6289 RepID=A0A7I4YGW0_HAECO